jgi:hypothetical protein
MANELTTTNILSLFQTTKEERASFVSDVITRIEEGAADPLKVHLQIKAMEDIVKTLNGNELYKSCLLSAAEKNGRKFNLYSAEFSIKEAGTSYDFNHCGHLELLNKLALIETLKGEAKEMQDMLKKLKQEGMLIVDEATGETYKVYPPIKSSTTTVQVVFK